MYICLTPLPQGGGVTMNRPLTRACEDLGALNPDARTVSPKSPRPPKPST